jgi:nicotinamidase-related amidase
MCNKNFETFNFDECSTTNSLIFVVDMVNGFIDYGNMASTTIKKIVPNLVEFLSLVQQKKLSIYFLNDAHHPQALEFQSYPSHCLQGTQESNIINELKTIKGTIIEKNSTNGFHALQKYDF